MSKKSVALIGLDVTRIDFSSPDYAHFARLGADGIKAMLETEKQSLAKLGFECEILFAPSDDLQLAKTVISSALDTRRWDCVLIGNGVRSIPSNFLLFELLINLVSERAPQARICAST